MRTFVARRLLALIPLLLAVTFITQALLVASPGSYITTLYESKKLTPELLHLLERQYHLESNNVFTRYWYWLWQALHGNFGFSFKYMSPVWGLVWQRLFNTLVLTVAALIISWGVAIPLGTLAGVKRGKWVDRCAGFVSFFGLSMPVVLFSLLMVMFAAKTGWFPIGGIHSQVYWDGFSWIQKVGDLIWHATLPAIVLGTVGMGQYMRQMRAEMIETLSQDYIRTAVAKGLPWRRVIFRHALGNAINPLVSLFGFSLAYLLAGAVLTETVFGWPGMGLLTFEALKYKDEPLVMASVVLLTVMLVIGSLSSDLLLAAIDPRVRLEEGSSRN
jgi:peptide/nickel transport system permease protein